MPRLANDIALAYWRRALRAKIGISIGTTDQRFLVNELYRARKEEADPDLDVLMIKVPPGGKEVWICHKLTEMP